MEGGGSLTMHPRASMLRAESGVGGDAPQRGPQPGDYDSDLDKNSTFMLPSNNRILGRGNHLALPLKRPSVLDPDSCHNLNGPF